MNAIVQNKHIFKDKVVLDVGCGTAILSMYVLPISLWRLRPSVRVFSLRHVVETNIQTRKNGNGEKNMILT